MKPPSADEQIGFLIKLQRLMQEGEFVATYKFALLLALVEVSVERGDDSGRELEITIGEIAEKFITAYWPQALT